MWRYVGGHQTEGVAGVPQENMTDDEFMEYNAKINAQFPDQPNSLMKCGLYEYHETGPGDSPGGPGGPGIGGPEVDPEILDSRNSDEKASEPSSDIGRASDEVVSTKGDK